MPSATAGPLDVPDAALAARIPKLGSLFNAWTIPLRPPPPTRTKSATSPELDRSPAVNPVLQSPAENKSPERYCNKRVIFFIYTLIFICMLNILHARFVHMYLT
jgi:hypothetical protein